MNIARLKAPDTVFIYQMGKVGSTALERALPNAVHMHSLFQNPPCPVRQDLHGGGVLSRLRRRISDKAKVSVIRSRPKTKIISLVRDPLDRNIAMFFQDLHFWLTAYIQKHPDRMREEGHQLLIDAFNELFPHKYPCDWFDLELKRLTGIDVFQHPFDKAAGFMAVSQESFEVLLIRTDALDRLLPELSEFVGFDVVIPSVNRGDAKWYGEAYRQFKNEYRPPEMMLSLLYESKFAKHFFTDNGLTID